MAELLTNRTINVYSSGFIERELVPQFIPNALTELTPADCHVTEIALSNTTAGAATVTVQDQQVTPTAILAAVSIPANTTYEISFRGRWCPGGLSWSCSADSTVIGAVRVY